MAIFQKELVFSKEMTADEIRQFLSRVFPGQVRTSNYAEAGYLRIGVQDGRRWRGIKIQTADGQDLKIKDQRYESIQVIASDLDGFKCLAITAWEDEETRNKAAEVMFQKLSEENK